MKRPSKFRTGITALLCSLLFLPTAASAQQPQPSPPTVRISTQEEIQAEFASVPCKNDERLQAARNLFVRMGAPDEALAVVQYGTNVQNLVVRKAGGSAETIIIGAHYDKVADGCGALDNWTGIVTLAHLYRSLKDVPLKKSLLFVAFGKEEKGLVGSHAMVEAMSKEEVAGICEMINIDSLGLSAPQVADNMSSKKMLDLATSVAEAMKMPFAHASIAGADADSSSFLAKKIPALTIHGLTGKWPEILHSSKDQAKLVDPLSVYLGYRLSLALLSRLNDAPCNAYR